MIFIWPAATIGETKSLRPPKPGSRYNRLYRGPGQCNGYAPSLSPCPTNRPREPTANGLHHLNSLQPSRCNSATPISRLNVARKGWRSGKGRIYAPPRKTFLERYFSFSSFFFLLLSPRSLSVVLNFDFWQLGSRNFTFYATNEYNIYRIWKTKNRRKK